MDSVSSPTAAPSTHSRAQHVGVARSGSATAASTPHALGPVSSRWVNRPGARVGDPSRVQSRCVTSPRDVSALPLFITSSRSARARGPTRRYIFSRWLTEPVGWCCITTALAALLSSSLGGVDPRGLPTGCPRRRAGQGGRQTWLIPNRRARPGLLGASRKSRGSRCITRRAKLAWSRSTPRSSSSPRSSASATLRS